MQVGNITTDMGTTVVGFSDTMIKNISFTPFQWAQFADAVNKSNQQALAAGLIIGSVAGVLGFIAAIKFVEWKKERDWQKYGKN